MESFAVSPYAIPSASEIDELECICIVFDSQTHIGKVVRRVTRIIGRYLGSNLVKENSVILEIFFGYSKLLQW